MVQLHFAGGHEERGKLIDSHSSPTPEEVWNLLERVVERFPVKGIILERNDDLPPFSEILKETDRARDCREARPMSLADDQTFLSRLLTDRTLLDGFLRDPERAAENAGFSRESSRRLAQIPREQLRDSGRSLIQKRAGAVANMLSQTRKALGHEAFQTLFRRLARWETTVLALAASSRMIVARRLSTPARFLARRGRRSAPSPRAFYASIRGEVSAWQPCSMVGNPSGVRTRTLNSASGRT